MMLPDEAEAPEDIGIGPQDAADADDAATPPGGSQEPLLAGDDDTDPADASPEPEETGPSAFWKTVDLRRVKVDDVPEEHRDAVEALQKQYKDAQRTGGRTLADLERQKQALDERERQLTARETGTTPPVGTPPAGALTATQAAADRKVSALIVDPGTDADTRNALVTMQKLIREELEPLRNEVKPLLDKFPEIQQAVGSMASKERQGHLDSLQTEIDTAIEAHSAEDIDRHSDAICRIVGLDGDFNRVADPMTNAATGEPHTVLTAYEMITGETAAAAQRARTEDEQIRDGAKEGASELSAVGSPPGELRSEDDYKAEVRRIMQME